MRRKLLGIFLYGLTLLYDAILPVCLLVIGVTLEWDSLRFPFLWALLFVALVVFLKDGRKAAEMQELRARIWKDLRE